jgi:hypothetical protein
MNQDTGDSSLQFVVPKVSANLSYYKIIIKNIVGEDIYLSEKSTLSVEKFGRGTIQSDIPGINCGDNCSAQYSKGSTVVLMAIPDGGYQFRFFA